MTLPVELIFPQLQSALSSHHRVVLQAPPGAGKSTCLPLLLLRSGHYSADYKIVMLEPRRVAARQIAQFLAKQLNEPVGKTIGLSMRGESKTSAGTVVHIVRDGVMVKQLQADPELQDIGLIIFDEFHERALQTDLALALALDAQVLNEQVRLLIMSATLDIIPLSEALGAAVVQSQGRQYPVDIHYISSSLMPRVEEVSKAVLVALQQHDSSILVFLSGVGEIKQVQRLLAPQLDDNVQCCPLYGGLSIAQQSMAIAPAAIGQRKVVLATNIAQTSLTIEGVDVVVDSGVEKISVYQPKLSSEQLLRQHTSLASAQQRAGRAGRLRAGHCYRLGSAEQYQRRREHDVAEIERVNLAALLLEVQGWGSDIQDLFWLTAPSETAIGIAKSELIQLGYWQKNEQGKISPTPLASFYQSYSMDLYLAKVLWLIIHKDLSSDLAISQQELLQTACVVIAYLEAGIRSNQLDLVESLLSMNSNDWSVVEANKLRLERLVASALPTKMANIGRSVSYQQCLQHLDTEIIGLLLSFAYPHRIAKKQGKQWKMSNGSGARFFADTEAAQSELILVLDFNRHQQTYYIQHYVALNIAQLKQYHPSLFIEQEHFGWSQNKQQPYKTKQQKIGELVLTETALPLKMSSSDWQRLWKDYIQDQYRFDDEGSDGSDKLGLGFNTKECQSLMARFHLAKDYYSQYINNQNESVNWPDWSVSALINNLDLWLIPHLSHVRNAQQLLAVNLAPLLWQTLNWDVQQLIEQYCPTHFVTPAKQKKKIDYQHQPPKLSVKLQEMFGQPLSPSICNGKLHLLIELLSPAQRPLQLTQDLSTFWENGYQDVKKEMRGRYPKHPWPDDPTTSVATHRTKARSHKSS